MALATGLVYGFLAITSQESIAQSSLQVSQAQISIAGEWNSSEGRIGFVQSGANVSGAYEMLEGLIDGKMSGNVLTGYWSQERSLILARCETPRRGRYVWGRIKFVFSNDRINGAVFRGYWGYCNKEPTFSWNGFRSRSWYGAPVKPLSFVLGFGKNKYQTKTAYSNSLLHEQSNLSTYPISGDGGHF
jgi:hypothetical protein